jgi:protein ImuB
MDEQITNPATLYACLFVNEFSSQALLRLRPELRNQPCAVMEGETPSKYVCSLNMLARALGVAKGMTQVEMDTFPSVKVLQRSIAEEKTTKSAILECATAFSPRIEDQSRGGDFLCVIDIAGTGMLFGAPQKLAGRLIERVASLGITARVSVSTNFHAAVCAARGMRSKSQPVVIPAGMEAEALASLPLSVLELSLDQAERFSLWGIHTLGMLATLPEKNLISRMGREGERLWQLAQGIRPHLFVPVEASFTLAEHMELDSPVELLTSLLFVISTMLEQIIVRASAHALALASVSITLLLEGNTSYTRTIRPALPSSDRQLWIKLIHLDLETHPPQAAILSLTVTAEPGSTSKVQLGLFSPQIPEAMQLDVTLARIRSIVGESNVGTAVLSDTHRPDSFQLDSFSVSTGNTAGPSGGQGHIARRQLRPAEKAAVTLRDTKPISFSFRDKRYGVERVYGPWLASGDWWNPTLWGSEEWDLIARSREGELLYGCLVRDIKGNKWHMVALYD